MAEDALINPWTGVDAEKAAAWESLSDNDKRWIGNGDPTDEILLARAPDAGALQRSNNSAALSQIPSYTEILNSVLDGSIFKNISGKLSSLSSAGVDTSEVSTIVSEARSTAMIDAAVAQATIAQKSRIARSEGRELSESEINDALAPLSTISSLDDTLNGSVASLSTLASGTGPVFGAAPVIDYSTSVTNPWLGIDEEKSAAWSMLSEADQRWIGNGDPTDEILLARAPNKGVLRVADYSSIASSITDFNATIPTAPTAPSTPIVSVTVNGVTLPNPDYATQLAEYEDTTLPGFQAAQSQFESDYSNFISDPGNAGKLAAAGDFASAAAGIGSSLVSSLTAKKNEGAEKKAAAIDLLKAEAMVSMLSKPQSKAVGSTLTSSIDTSKFDAYTVIKAQESEPAPLPPVVEKASDNYRSQPTSSAVKTFEPEPRTENISQRVTSFDVNNLTKKRQEAAKIFNSYMGLGSFDDTVRINLVKEKMLEDFDAYLGPVFAAENSNAKRIEKEKPDAASRSAEEAALVEKRQKLFRPNFFRSAFYKGYLERLELYNLYAVSHKEAFDAWMKDQTFDGLPSVIQQAITAPLSEVTNYQFGTYTDFPPTAVI
jgi:hypothetical protein